MANEEKVKVYEQKQGGFNWLWLLPLLLLVPLLFWLLGRDRTPEVATRTETEQPAAAPAPANPAPAATAAVGEALTDLDPVYGAQDRSTYADRRADLGRARVRRVLSDRVFTVGPVQGDREMFVMLDEKLDQGGAEQAVQIKPGQELSLAGVIERPPSTETRAERFRGLNQTEADQLVREQVYLHANRVAAAR